MRADSRRPEPAARPLTSPAVLLVTADPLLPARVIEQLPSSWSMSVADDIRTARRAWSSARHVLVDAGLAGVVRRARLPARPRVWLLLSTGTQPLDWEDAVQIGIDRMLEPDEVGWWLTSETEPAGLAEPAGPGGGVPFPSPFPSLVAPAGTGRLVVVTGACGGTGASTLAAALAMQAAGRRVLVDLDGAGGGVDLVLGLEERPGPRWSEVLAAGPEASFEALPTADDGDLAVLSHDGRPLDGADPAGVVGVLEAACRRYALVVADLPRGGAVDLLPATARDDAVLLLVVPPDVRGCAAALHRMRPLGGWPDLRLVIGPRPGPLLDEVTVGVGLDLPLAGVLPYDPAVPAAAARGELPGRSRRSSYGRAVADLLRNVESVESVESAEPA